MDIFNVLELYMRGDQEFKLLLVPNYKLSNQCSKKSFYIILLYAVHEMFQ